MFMKTSRISFLAALLCLTTAITSCYQFPGPGYSDTSGTFMVTDKCYYIN